MTNEETGSWYCSDCKILLNYKPDFCPNCRKGYFIKYSDFEMQEYR